MGSSAVESTYLTVDEDSDDDDMLIPASEHFHPGVCSVCYQRGVTERPILRCSQCQLVPYCSRICQKKDWSKHRPVCCVNKVTSTGNVFSASKEKMSGGGDWKLWHELRTEMALTTSLKLNRTLTMKEREVFMYPRVCDVCKESKSDLLKGCDVCCSLFYCGDEHKEQDKDNHLRWCDMYLLGLECDSLEATRGFQDLPFPTHVDAEYKPLAEDLTAHLNPLLNVNPDQPLDHRLVAMIGERLSFPMTILYAMERIGTSRNGASLLNRTEICIHVVGAESSVELLGIIRWEYLLHRLPSVRKLRIAFVGPELYSSIGEGNQDDPSIDRHCIDDSGGTRCEECVRSDRKVIYEMNTSLYHDYKNTEHYSTPDIICAFNCGFHEFHSDPIDTWSSTLKSILSEAETPLVFTSYTLSEAEKDFRALSDASPSETLIESHLNPFRSPRPFRDPAREDGNQLFVYNQILTCVKKPRTNNGVTI